MSLNAALITLRSIHAALRSFAIRYGQLPDSDTSSGAIKKNNCLMRFSLTIH